ncbi:MAG: glycosyltransferase family 4 protein [Actinomycetota bacterium]
MRVGLVCPYALDAPGGVQNHVLNLSAQLARLGHEVGILAPSLSGEPALAGDGVAVWRAGRAVRVPYNRSVAPISAGPAAWRAAGRFVAQGFEVVHVHEPAVPGASLYTTARCRVPMVGTFHATAERSRLVSIAGPIIRRTLARLAARTAVSRPAASFAATYFPGEYSILPNGVDPALFSPAPRLSGTGDADAPTLLFIGRLEPRKGFEYAVRAWVLVKKRRPRARLVVVGEGAERQRCVEMVPPEMRGDLVLAGTVSADSLPSYYQSADVFMAPSLGGESFGIVLAEAMAAGIPVVASEVSGYHDVLSGTGAGILVPPGDAEALAAGVESLLADEATRKGMGKAGREAARRYSWETLVEGVLEIYQRVLRAED